MRRHHILAAACVLVAASCGVSRGDHVVAGRDLSRADSSESPTTSSPEVDTSTSAPVSPTTPTTGAPDAVAASVTFDGGEVIELRHGELNDIVVPTQENSEFVGLVYGGAAPPGFDTVVLSQAVLAEIIGNELQKVGSEPTDDDLAAAKAILFQTLTGLFPGSGDPDGEAERLFEEVPYLPFLVDLQARQIALAGHLAEAADPSEQNPCVRHILVATEAEADELLVELEGGADFAELAQQRSTGPSGPTGGDLGCAAAAGYVPEFAAAVEAASEGEATGPVETQYGWHVLVVEGYEADGNALADQVIHDGLIAATVEVDEQVGSWDVEQLIVVPAGS